MVSQQFDCGPNNEKVAIGRALVDRITFKQAVEKILAMSQARDSKYIVTPNADHVLQLEADAEFCEVYSQAALVTCDGNPLLWASRWLGSALPQTVTGADLLPALCKYGAAAGLRIALIGGPPNAAELAGRNLEVRYPGLQVVWTNCPPLGFERSKDESEKIVDELNHRNVDIVFVGVGAPKQEKWMFQHRKALRVGVMLGIGAAIEFAAGTLPRAPKLFRYLGLEWAFRLVHDPRRLAVRYLRNLRFFFIIYRQWVHHDRPRT